MQSVFPKKFTGPYRYHRIFRVSPNLSTDKGMSCGKVSIVCNSIKNKALYCEKNKKMEKNRKDLSTKFSTWLWKTAIYYETLINKELRLLFRQNKKLRIKVFHRLCIQLHHLKI